MARAALAVMCAVFAAAVAVAVAMAMVGGPSAKRPAECVVEKLKVCAPAVVGGAAPTEDCCTILKTQRNCFCIYARNPTYSHYVSGTTALKAISSCGISSWTCLDVAPAIGV